MKYKEYKRGTSMNYKMIGLDMDGTLLNDEKEISYETKQALLTAQEKGAVIVLASGRPLSGLKKFASELFLHDNNGFLLSYNGGKVVSAVTGDVIHEVAMEQALCRQMLIHLEQFNVDVFVDDGINLYVTDKNGYKVDYEASINDLAVVEVDNLAAAIQFRPVKILVSAPPEKLDQITPAIMEGFEEQLGFVKSAPFYLEITTKGINKGAAFERLIQHVGVGQHELMAFGDAQNDLAMIEYVGHGVAMGNACHELKAIAKEVTLSNNEDGIAKVLRRYF